MNLTCLWCLLCCEVADDDEALFGVVVVEPPDVAGPTEEVDGTLLTMDD